MNKIILILILILSTQQMFACNCIGETSIKDDIKSSKLIFKGLIIKKEVITTYNSDTIYVRSFYNKLKDKEKYKSYEDYKESVWGTKLLEYTVENLGLHKGRSKSDFIKIRTGFGGGDCGYEFEIDKTYLIFANNAEYVKFSKNHLKSKWKTLKKVYETNICMRTKLLSESTDELKKL